MYLFSNFSLTKLNTCHLDLQLLFSVVVRSYDCKIICGYRSKYDQDQAFLTGASKVQYPNSKHNLTPSMASDVAPYQLGKGVIKNVYQCYHFVGFVLKTAETLGIPIRCGADWNMNKNVTDQKFNDLWHFELINEYKLK